ncbi:unnamed protein product [Pseudo-nitzschia multistriata]|uniref:Radical SAM core domain-containing protein n=1 Tax=Pseudo-nitzschia multistriata TaxID=183589 RepID=A0A448Z0Q5_9STRA|nr:unnamed protein product [Pseudo-nitzschia multistriata]
MATTFDQRTRTTTTHGGIRIPVRTALRWILPALACVLSRAPVEALGLAPRSFRARRGSGPSLPELRRGEAHVRLHAHAHASGNGTAAVAPDTRDGGTGAGPVESRAKPRAKPRAGTGVKAAPDPSGEWLADRVRSVNYFVSRKCNYSCKFCFHTQKTTHTLPAEDAVRGLCLLRAAGTEKINFAGGEPFVRPHLLGRLCKAAHEMGMAVSIISNGSLVTEEWMRQYGYYVDILGVSVDSFDPETNALIGRGGDAHNRHVDRMRRVRRWCEEHNIKFKINTVVCKHNVREDMTQQMLELDPVRWKVFQVLVLEGENAGAGDLRDARELRVTDDEYQAFVDRHRPSFSSDVLIPESNAVMQNSYLLLDEDLRFLDCSAGGKVPSASILEVGVETALRQAGFDADMFRQRGGVFEWTRDRSGDAPRPELRP